MSHEDIKKHLLEEGAARGLKPGDLKVLSTDPFFVGSVRDYTDARWVAALWDKMMLKRRKALHLRGFHYWIQSQGIAKPNGEKYAHGANPAKDWGYLLHCAQMARYLGIGKWENFVDLKHPDAKDYDNYFVGSGLSVTGEVDIQTELDGKLEGLVNEFINELIGNSPRYHADGYQLYHHEVWCEKNSMNFIIEPVCRKYGACVQSLVGQASVEKVDLMSERFISAARSGKKARLWYISDSDRYGISMVSAVARKLEFRIFEEKLDAKVTRLALTDEQIKKFNLPKAPKHDEAVVELDALEAIHPGELGKIIEAKLKPYYDEEKVKIVETENRRIRDMVRMTLEDKLREPLTNAFKEIDLKGMAGEVKLTDAIDLDFEPPTPGNDVDESSTEWMFDSNRTYIEQLAEYRKYKLDNAEEALE